MRQIYSHVTGRPGGGFLNRMTGAAAVKCQEFALQAIARVESLLRSIWQSQALIVRGLATNDYC